MSLDAADFGDLEDVLKALGFAGDNGALNEDWLADPIAYLKTMLANDIEQERIDVAHYIKLSQLAEKEGYFSLKMKMEEQAADEDGHANELKRLLS